MGSAPTPLGSTLDCVGEEMKTYPVSKVVETCIQTPAGI